MPTMSSITPPSISSTGFCKDRAWAGVEYLHGGREVFSGEDGTRTGFSSRFASTSRSTWDPSLPRPSCSKEHSMAKTQAPRIDHFFSAVAARLDLWRDLNRAAQAWAANRPAAATPRLQAACSEALTALLPLEDFQAYPGARVLNAIKERVAAGDAHGHRAAGAARSSALMSRSYRRDAGEWDSEDDAPRPERAMPTALGRVGARPYFEVLFVTPTPPVRWPAHAAADAQAPAAPGRVRLRAGVRRLVRGRGAGRDPQHQPRVGGDLRRLPLRVVARRAAAEEPAGVQAVRSTRRTARRATTA